MNEYRIVWQQCPHINFPKRVLFVEAHNATDAETLARDHVERKHRIEWFTVYAATPVEILPPGRVKTED